MYRFKVIIAGDKNVGKSSLITRFCDNSFDEHMKETIGVAFKRKKVIVVENDHEFALGLNIWDFGGEEKYRKLFPSYAYNANAALILFDTTNEKSLNAITNWVKMIEDNCMSNVVKLLIATKIDLKEKREVSKKKAMEYCNNYNWYQEIIKTSSKTGENVEETFLTIAKNLLKRNLQKCKDCGTFFSIKLKFCSLCGGKTEMGVSPI
ncbi:MAG: GTP-binding protein [Candidatus Lokiarchaeota archaeon]|nr:GTP-binding protein [Candidatus Lokiarchaeota archaeon]